MAASSMNDVRDQVGELLRLRSFALEPYQAISECCVEEESDMYGFSLISSEYHSRSSSNDILTHLMEDQNWNNPGNVCLMCQAYQIDETYRSVVFGSTLFSSGSTYRDIKSQQHLMFSERYYLEGVTYKNRGLWSESIKSLSDALVYNGDNINARIERADSYFRQNKKTEALVDYKHVLIAQPNHTLALERTMLLRNNTHLPLSANFNSAAGTQMHSSSKVTSRIQLIDRATSDYSSNVSSASSSNVHDSMVAMEGSRNTHAEPLVYKNTNLIGKLQQALLDNPNYFDTSSSSSSSSEDSSNSDSDDSNNQSRGSSKKRKRDEHKSKKERKTHKKRKSKHKKDKHNKDSKRKKKHKSEK